jgi:hypothetical protein
MDQKPIVISLQMKGMALDVIHDDLVPQAWEGHCGILNGD